LTGPRRHCAALLAALALVSCNGAPDQPPPSPALWEVTGAHGEHGYLFGTIHDLPDGIRWHTQRIDEAFTASDTLAVEVAGLNSPQAIKVIFDQLATAGHDLPPLGSRVPVASRELIEHALAEKHFSDSDFVRTETWAAALTLATAFEAGDSANGVDRELLKKAEGKRVVELEGAEPQLRIFDALPEKEQADLLVAAAQDASAGPEKQHHRLEQWLIGDVAALADYSADPILADPELRQALLIARNNAWLETIDHLLSQGRPLFVAVGAAHVIGPDGLAVLLAERGYKVTRIQ
jgi:uncharacterized protein YbaP (TraB family)